MWGNRPAGMRADVRLVVGVGDGKIGGAERRGEQRRGRGVGEGRERELYCPFVDATTLQACLVTLLACVSGFLSLF